MEDATLVVKIVMMRRHYKHTHVEQDRLGTKAELVDSTTWDQKKNKRGSGIVLDHIDM